jgi:hypothetical protein
MMLSLSLLHIWFPRYFGWRKELVGLSLINRQMMYVHTFFIGLVLFMMALIALFEAPELINTKLGNHISLTIGTFWTIRLLIQLFVYSSQLWRGKKKETMIHIVFTATWTYLATVFFAAGTL